ncbi:hypothetical protein ABE042_04690 [Viridibacillus arvi]|uniref:hypothetical protein n=1 Tax=Viridibacillus arvi TaxID=263475 RepID=UPI003D2E5ACD
MGNEITIAELNVKLKQNTCAFLVGNGFSMNFDSDFADIYSRLYTSHKDVLHKTIYDVNAENNNFTKKYKRNYKLVIQHLRNISEAQLLGIFEDALIFAEHVRSDNQIVKSLWDSGKISKLTFGLSEIDILNSICEVGRDKGIKYVNIENWTILIYFYFAIKSLDAQDFQFPNQNSFITVVEKGNTNFIRLIPEDPVFENVITNGFATYYRMLFSVAIFAQGKAMDTSLLENINDLNIPSIKEFLNKFDTLISLNYDSIMESVAAKPVEHLHGEYVKGKKEYTLHQSLGMKFNDEYVSFSDLLIGDYFIFKTRLHISNVLSSIRNPLNKQTSYSSKNLELIVQKKRIDTIVIFGMNIENDQHVLRNIMLSFYEAKQTNPEIIYCYFSPQEKEEFGKEFDEVITFSEEVSQYSKNIKVSCIRTQDVLKEFFK